MVYIAHAHDSRGHAENQWNHALSHWNCDTITFDEVPDDIPLVVLSPEPGYSIKGTESLVTFEHPEDAVYLFGSDHKHLTQEQLPREPDHVVYIPLPGYAEMYSWVAFALVMYDREAKRG